MPILKNASVQKENVDRENTSISCMVSGTGDITLLFVHGSYIDQTYWKSQVDYFSKYYKVVTLDLPGHGESGKDRQNWSMTEYSLDVIAVISELNLRNVILIGHSMGGDINLMVAHALRSEVIGFISIDNFKNAATPVPEQYGDHVKQILHALKTDFAQTNEQYARMALITEGTPDYISLRVRSDYRNAYQPMGLKLMPEFFKMYEIERELLPMMKFKLHLIDVDYLPIDEEPLKLYAGHGYDVQHMGGTCHFPMLENPYQLNILIKNAIEKIKESVIAGFQYFQN